MLVFRRKQRLPSAPLMPSCHYILWSSAVQCRHRPQALRRGHPQLKARQLCRWSLLRPQRRRRPETPWLVSRQEKHKLGKMAMPHTPSNSGTPAASSATELWPPQSAAESSVFCSRRQLKWILHLCSKLRMMSVHVQGNLWHARPLSLHRAMPCTRLCMWVWKSSADS